MHFVSLRHPITLVLVLILAVACSSGTSPTSLPSPSPSATLPPAPAPTPAASSCPLGYGSGRFTCQGDPMPGLLDKVQAAIDKLVADKPDLFDLNNPSGDHGYLVRDQDAFYNGVSANLLAMGMCSQLDPLKETLSVKEDNSYSEDYHLVTSQSRIRWGIKSYIRSCTPANFPLTPETAVAKVTVSFFGINCPVGETPPPPPLNQLPAGCQGPITATPRDAVGNKLPPELHGLDIKWSFRAGEGTVVASWPDPNQAFNMYLYGVAVGDFSICATVQNVTGCLNGQVIPSPSS